MSPLICSSKEHEDNARHGMCWYLSACGYAGRKGGSEGPHQLRDVLEQLHADGFLHSQLADDHRATLYMLGLQSTEQS